MNIEALYLYPVKSLAGISVDAFEIDDFGPRGDRRWMIVDSDRQFVTQRSNPELSRVKTRLEEGQALITIPGEGSFRLVPGKEQVQVRVWQDWVPAAYGSDGASAALSRFCGAELRLVYMTDDSFRRVDEQRVTEYRRVSFADGFPFLVVNRASLDELNQRLESAVDMLRFRPNVVVSGAEAWAEDHWESLQIGSITLDLVKPCSRCVMTTVDPDTGRKAPDLQPLRTLGSYRRSAEGVIFGMNGIHENTGTIALGDAISLK
ncbi:MOSC domain-containing protein [Marinobacter sp. CHS3-4]|nr:MOSC N-terminal beta barrel domain-containing protein [Marinobacter sp. CHS3-4]MDI9245237.1 MOSC domain-containing protein [Marinobacter sp. CHS3-4]